MKVISVFPYNYPSTTKNELLFHKLQTHYLQICIHAVECWTLSEIEKRLLSKNVKFSIYFIWIHCCILAFYSKEKLLFCFVFTLRFFIYFDCMKAWDSVFLGSESFFIQKWIFTSTPPEFIIDLFIYPVKLNYTDLLFSYHVSRFSIINNI